MLDIEGWIDALAPEQEWRGAYAVIEREAKAFLDGQPASAFFTTTALADELFPPPAKDNETAKAARQRLFRGFAACAEHGLKPYCQKGAPKTIFGKAVTPLVWRKPK